MDIIESNLKFKDLSYGNQPEILVLHHAAISMCSVEDVHKLHLGNGWAGCGYHFLVRKDGSIYRGRPEESIGAHCIGANDISIGICAEGNYMQELMPEKQKISTVNLCKYVMKKYNIEMIKCHKELNEGTDCPGINYPFEEIKELILK